MTERKTITLWLAVNELGESRMSWDSAADAIDELRDNDGFDARNYEESVPEPDPDEQYEKWRDEQMNEGK